MHCSAPGPYFACLSPSSMPAAEERAPLEGLPLGAVVKYDIPLRLAARVLEVLAADGITAQLHDRVEPDPRIEVLYDCLAAAKAQGVSVEEAERRRLASIPAGRFGDAWEFGQACAYLCSAQAGFVTGQNFLIDGGAYPGTF